MEFTEETRCASMALATNLDNSDDHKLVVRIFSRGTQLAYTPTTVSRSGTAVPSARNSGFDNTWNFTPGLAPCSRTALTASEVLTGTVDFSTTILSEVETSAIVLAQSSQFLTFAARPAPMPAVLVGVFTLIKTISASAMDSLILVENTKLPLFKPTATTSSKPGS